MKYFKCFPKKVQLESYDMADMRREMGDERDIWLEKVEESEKEGKGRASVETGIPSLQIE